MNEGNENIIPKRFDRVVKLLEDDSWKLSRISGSHHIFTKSGRRCIPVAFHGGIMPKFHARRVLKQAGIIGPNENGDHKDIHEFHNDDGEETSRLVEYEYGDKEKDDGCNEHVIRNLSSKLDKKLAIDDIPKDEFEARQKKERGTWAATWLHRSGICGRPEYACQGRIRCTAANRDFAAVDGSWRLVQPKRERVR